MKLSLLDLEVEGKDLEKMILSFADEIKKRKLVSKFKVTLKDGKKTSQTILFPFEAKRMFRIPIVAQLLVKRLLIGLK